MKERGVGGGHLGNNHLTFSSPQLSISQQEEVGGGGRRGGGVRLVEVGRRWRLEEW